MIPYQLIKSLDCLLTIGYLIVVPHATIHPFPATFVTLKPATYLFPLQMEPPRSTFKGTSDEGQRSILGLPDVNFIEGLSHRLLSLTAISATQNFTVIIRNRATTICFPNNSKYAWPLLLHELPAQQAFSTMSKRGNATPSETTS
jgi:hypothetical protein